MHGAKFDEFYGSGKKYVKKIFRMADMVLSVSYYYAKFMQDNHLNENVECLHNGITGRNKDYIPPTKSDLVKFSYFGAIDNRKGIFDVLETIGENRDKLAGKIKLTIGGVGDMSKFNAIVEKYDLNNIVEYSGWLDKNAKDKLLSTTDVFIHPSHSESFGISILEAMDYGLPIITTSIGGIPDLVTDGINGIIVTPGDRQQIMSAMMKLISDEKLRIKLGANSIIAAKKFYLPEIETHLNALYQSVIGYNYNTNDKHIK